MSKFKEYLKEQTYDFKGMFSFGNGDTSVRGSKIGIPPAVTPKLGIKNLRVGVEALEGWQNPVAMEACINIMNYFGVPNILTSSKAKWFKIAGFDKVCVNDEAIPNYTPKFHVECVYGTKTMTIPLEMHTPLAAVSQSFMFDTFKQQITARCSSIVGCAVMLGFAEDVVKGEVEADFEEFMDRYENFDVPEWFERATGGVGAFLEFEDRKHQEAQFRKEMLRTGGKYGRGYHWKIGKVPMDMEQDLNIKESLSEAEKYKLTDKEIAFIKKAVPKMSKKVPGTITWQSLAARPDGTTTQVLLKGMRSGKKPEDVEKWFKPLAKKIIPEEAKMDVDWKKLEDPDEEEYLNDVLSKAKKMGDDEMIKRIMTMLASKEKNITNEYP